jgi:hypothetical protein
VVSIFSWPLYTLHVGDRVDLGGERAEAVAQVVEGQRLARGSQVPESGSVERGADLVLHRLVVQTAAAPGSRRSVGHEVSRGRPRAALAGSALP